MGLAGGRCRLVCRITWPVMWNGLPCVAARASFLQVSEQAGTIQQGCGREVPSNGNLTPMTLKVLAHLKGSKK